jgi:uncharacterized protein YdbL (DUF1318 family)
MLRRILPFLTIALLLPLPALALSLDEAKAQGLVGERMDGYLGPVQNTPETVALVRDINQQRRAEYEKIAAGNGQPVAVVQSLAAQKAYAKTPTGFYIQDNSGAWVKK